MSPTPEASAEDVYVAWTAREEMSSYAIAYALLAATICLEGFATLSLKLASEHGLPWLISAYLAYGGAFALFPRVLETIQMGEAYAIWSGVGCALTALEGRLCFGEALTLRQWGSIAVILCGVCGLML